MPTGLGAGSNSFFKEGYEDHPILNNDSSAKVLKDASVPVPEAEYVPPTNFSFADVDARIILPFDSPQGKLVKLPGLTIVSFSGHRETFTVTALGNKGIQGFTTGHRVTAGSLGFTIIRGESAFAEPLRRYAAWKGTPGDTAFSTPDELPPFNLQLTFVNKYNQQAFVGLRGVKIVDESANISVRDVQLTEMYSFMATRRTSMINANEQIETKVEPIWTSFFDKSDPFFTSTTGATGVVTDDEADSGNSSDESRDVGGGGTGGGGDGSSGGTGGTGSGGVLYVPVEEEIS